MSLTIMTTEPAQPAAYIMPVNARATAQQAEQATAAPVQPLPKAEKPLQEDVEKIVQDINENLQAMHTELNFSVDKETDKMVLKIVNSRTQEVIRQIPAEDALRIASRLSKLLGLLVDGNA